MSVIHTEYLAGFGYSHKEIAFLDLVTAHSGYFVPNQFLNFTGLKRGRALAEFREKLIGWKHASFHTYRNGARVYHTSARRLYQAFGRDGLGTCRRHSLESIRTRLVALDFVIANQSCQFLHEEAHKLQCLREQFSVAPEDLPSRTYTNPRNGRSRVRYFADQFPMFWMPTANPEEALLAFTFIDSGQPTVQPLITHLSSYRPLFSRLKAFAFLYVAPTALLFAQAEAAFEKIVLGAEGGRREDELLRYFRIRRAWERDERVPGADVVYLKNSRSRFQGTETESLYRQWASDLLSTRELREIWRNTFASSRVEFRTAIHGRSLSVFSGDIGRQFRTSDRVFRGECSGMASAEPCSTANVP